MLEPTTLPATISEAPRSTASTEDTSSGSEVPIETIVTPTRNAGRPKP